jgi:hypothetical protein
MYKLDNSRYPNTEQGLQALVTARPPSRTPATTRKAAISAVCRRTRGE